MRRHHEQHGTFAGFINMLSWSTDSLIADGLGQSELRQGVTTQVMGEGMSWGPVNDAIKKRGDWPASSAFR
jgi:hypothetical protein